MEITFESEDKSLNIRLVYIVKTTLRYYKGLGPSYVKCTQCLCFINGLLVGFDEVIKHYKDDDNQKYAYKFVTKKVIKKINLKFIRKEIWAKVLVEIEK